MQNKETVVEILKPACALAGVPNAAIDETVERILREIQYSIDMQETDDEEG